MSETTEYQDTTFAARIMALERGASMGEVRRFDADKHRKDDPMHVMRDVRNSVQHAVIRAQQRTKRKFVVETGEFRTTSRDIVGCICVTRLS